MKIVITDKAKDFLKKKNEKILTIDLFIAGSCIEIAEPIAKLGAPKIEGHKFDVFKEDGYTVFYLKGIDAVDDCLTVTVSKFLGSSSLVVKGIRLL